MSARHKRLRRALDIMTEGNIDHYPTRMRTRKLERELEQFRRRHRPWLESRAIQGFGISERVKKGRRLSTLMLVIYVRRKIYDRRKIAHPIPHRIRIPRLGRFATDVVQLGKFRLHEFHDKARPVMPGCSVGLDDGVAGTLGCYVRRAGAPPNSPPMLLTCAHVLTKEFLSPGGGVVEQPARINQTMAGPFAIGSPTQTVPVVFSPAGSSFPNEVDAGVASLSPTIARHLPIRVVNVRPTAIADVVHNENVRKVGWVTGLTSGKAINIAFKFPMEFPDPLKPGQKRRAGFTNLVLAEYSAREGDSGALVLNDADAAIGIHIGGWEGKGVFCRFHRVADLLGIVPY